MKSDNNQQPSVLYLVHRVPYPPDKGDRIRTFHILRFLSQRAKVYMACLADEPVKDEVVQQLHEYCQEVGIVPIGKLRWLSALRSLAFGRTITEGAFTSRGLKKVLKAWCERTEFRAVLASSSAMIPYLRLPELQTVPAVVDLIDVDSQKWFDYSKLRSWPLSQIFRTEGRRLRHLEQDLPSNTRAVTLVSDAESDLYRQFSSFKRVETVSNGVATEYFRGVNENEPESGCVFIGALDYFPNIDGAIWFCREVWPEIHRRHPDAIFSLVGRRPTPGVQKLGQIPGVNLVGQVPDVRPYLAKAAVAVIPLRIARGLQNKVIEAMAMGKAVVASPEAVAGLRAEAGVDLEVAKSPAEWVELVSQLLNDKQRRADLAAAGRQYVEAHHDWEKCLEPLAELLNLDGQAETADAASSRQPVSA